MTALFDQVSELFRAGHAGQSPVLFGDQRLDGITEFRPAAVLIALTDRPEPGVLLLHRPSNMRAHPGQVAFPGGKFDPGETAEQAALREAHEELGIDPAKVQVIGTSDVYRTHSGYAITPVLAVVPADIAITPNPMEVAQWFEPPFGYVLDPANHEDHWVDWDGGVRMYYEIRWREHSIWGVTAGVLINLSRRLNWHGMMQHG